MAARKRHNQKLEREEQKEADAQKANWVAAETKKWQPVDRADAQNQKRIQAKSNKTALKATKAIQKAADAADFC